MRLKLWYIPPSSQIQGLFLGGSLKLSGKHFFAPVGGQLKSIFRSQFFATLLLVSGLSVLCVGLALQLGRVLSVALPEIAKGPTNLVQRPKPLSNARSHSCESVVDLVHWSEQKMGRRNVLIASREKAIMYFLEAIDPRKILLTESEVHSFRASASTAWQALSEKGNCEFFARWHASRSKDLKARFHAGLAQVVLQDAAVGATGEAEYEGWAKDEDTLKERLAELGNAQFKGSSAALLSVYGNDPKAMVSDALEDSLEGLETPVSEVLAKSILKAIDKYSSFFSSDEFQDFYADLSGGSSGLGIRVKKVPTGIFIEKVLKDSAAERTGKIFAGDVIAKIDGVSVGKIPFSRAKQLLKGAEGSRVSLSIIRRNHRPLVVSVQRMPFALEDSSVSGKWIKSKGKSVAMVHIPSFYGRGGMGFGTNERSSFEDVEAVLEKLYAQGDASAPLVLDLRGNPGGYLEESVAIGSLFVGSQPIVGVSEQNNTRILREEGAMPLRPEGTMIILVDEDTASASEVLAGALKDYQKAIVVGTPSTYGKGSVQKLFHLSDPILQVGITDSIGNGVVKLTTSTFYSPLGHSPVNGGVKSQLVIRSAEEKFDEQSGIPDLAPLIDETALGMIRANEVAVQEQVAALRLKVDERKRTGQSGASSTDAELSEAIAIAIDASEEFSTRPQ